jgi:hypothetical protein
VTLEREVQAELEALVDRWIYRVMSAALAKLEIDAPPKRRSASRRRHRPSLRLSAPPVAVEKREVIPRGTRAQLTKTPKMGTTSPIREVVSEVGKRGTKRTSLLEQSLHAAAGDRPTKRGWRDPGTAHDRGGSSSDDDEPEGEEDT